VLENIKLPLGLKAVEVKDLTSFPYNRYKVNIIMFRLSGDPSVRKQEEDLIKAAKDWSFNNVFLILTPFHFESHVDLEWVKQQLDKLSPEKRNIEIIDMDTWFKDSCYATFSETFKSVQGLIELICTIYCDEFRG